MKNLFKALANFQYDVPVILKGTQGYGYKYADLPTIFEVITPYLKKHNLGFTQLLNTKDGVTYITTCVFHTESGESFESNVAIPYVQLAKMNDYQAFGSGCSYYRRYALSSALCLVSDSDNDGAGEQIRTQKESKKTLSDNQFKKLVGAINTKQKDNNGIDINVDYAVKQYDLTSSQIELLNTLQVELLNTLKS